MVDFFNCGLRHGLMKADVQVSVQCAFGLADNSPAFQGWVMRQPDEKVPQATAEVFFRPCGTLMSLRD
jgi:hypothetical protein